MLEEVFDARRTVAELEGIDRSLGLDDRLVAAVEVLQARMRRMFALFHSMRLRPPAEKDPAAHRARQEADTALLNDAVVDLIGADVHRLRCHPLHAATVLRTMTFSLTHPMLGDAELASPRCVVDLVLHGVLRSTPC